MTTSPTNSQLLLAGSAALAGYGVYQILSLLYSEWTSPLRTVPGPPSPSFIYGHVQEMRSNDRIHEKWVAQYGHTLKYKTLFGGSRLYTVDLKATHHILMNHNTYHTPEATKIDIKNIIGNGLLVAVGDEHKKQRRIMNPAFGPGQIRELTEVFMEKAAQLRDLWTAEIAKEAGKAKLDTLDWLHRTTLDVIGLAGFNYEFNALTRPNEDELGRAFATALSAPTAMSLAMMLKLTVPGLSWLPAEGDDDFRKARQIMDKIAKNLLADSKAAQDHAWDSTPNGKRSRDLLSVLVKANNDNDLPEAQRMSDEDVLAQIPTFFVAGHETTSAATTWALYALSQAPEVQAKLRDELLTLPTDSPSFDELNSLTYLEWVVRETLRLHAPIPAVGREAVKDDILPLSHPIRDAKGKIISETLLVKKGQIIRVPIVALNHSKEIWGDDALEFRPERWEAAPEGSSRIPGVWGNQLTFLGGPRACIGFRFTLAEMKALLFTLVKSFEFELAVSPDDIIKMTGITVRPALRSDPSGKNQMPMFIRPFVVQ